MFMYICFSLTNPSLYAGIKNVGYSQRQWDNPQDPRLIHTAADSHETLCEREPIATSEPDASCEESPLAVMEELMREPEEMLAKEKEQNGTSDQNQDDDDDDDQDQDDVEQAQDDGEQDQIDGEQHQDEISEEKNLTDELKSSHCQEERVPLQSTVDSIVDEQLQDFSAGMMSLLKQKQVSYRAPHASLPPAVERTLMKPFSDYVARHHAPVPLYGFVRTLRNSLTSYIDSHLKVSVPEAQAGASSALTTSQPSSPDSTLSSDAAPVFSASGSKPSDSIVTRPRGSTFPSVHAQSSPPLPHPKNPSSSQPCMQSEKSLPRLGTCKEAPDLEPWLLEKSKWRPDGRDAKEMEPCRRVSSPLTDVCPENFHAESSSGLGNDTVSSGADPSPSSLTNLINKLNPEMFSSLVEIIKGVRKNSVHFYIHSNDGERSQVCTDIKVSI